MWGPDGAFCIRLTYGNYATGNYFHAYPIRLLAWQIHRRTFSLPRTMGLSPFDLVSKSWNQSINRSQWPTIRLQRFGIIQSDEDDDDGSLLLIDGDGHIIFGTVRCTSNRGSCVLILFGSCSRSSNGIDTHIGMHLIHHLYLAVEQKENLSNRMKRSKLQSFVGFL
jgi:hypothetical protein